MKSMYYDAFFIADLSNLDLVCWMYRDELEESKEAKARRAVRSNNFTQQTNALDVDKHM